MSERFFVATPPAAGRAILSGDEARHLTRVLRARVGDAVTLFDGRGQAWQAQVAAIGRHDVELETGAAVADPPTACRPLSLAVALPKGERQKWLVEKLTELGATRLIPLVTTRGVAEATPAARERLMRGVIEACKQCGRNRLMEIPEPESLADLVVRKDPAVAGIIAEPGGGSLEAAIPRAASEILALVGPDGGFTPDELATARAAGFVPVSLGPHVLRIETAAIAVAARLAESVGQ